MKYTKTLSKHDARVLADLEKVLNDTAETSLSPCCKADFHQWVPGERFKCKKCNRTEHRLGQLYYDPLLQRIYTPSRPLTDVEMAEYLKIMDEGYKAAHARGDYGPINFTELHRCDGLPAVTPLNLFLVFAFGVITAPLAGILAPLVVICSFFRK